MLTQNDCNLIDSAEDYPAALAAVARAQQEFERLEVELTYIQCTPVWQRMPRGECHSCGSCTGEMICHTKTEAQLTRKLAAAYLHLAQTKITLSRCYTAAKVLGEAQ